MGPQVVISLISLLSLITNVNAQIYTGSANIIDSNSVSITIDYNTNTVVLVLDGSPHVWYGFAFGNTVMDGTYSIIMEYNRNDLSQGLVWEFTLGNHRAGNIYKTKEITVLSDISDGQIRSVSITRPINGIYTFPNPPVIQSIPFIINIMSAIGSIPSDYQTARNAAHLSTNMASTSMTLHEVTQTQTQIPTQTPPQTQIPNIAPLNPIQNDNDIQCENCRGERIECISNNECSIQCLSENACYNSTIACNSNSNCLIEAVNLNSLGEANIISPIGYDIDILCNDVFSCQNTKIYATYSSGINMYCSGIKSCQDFEIFCPPYNEANVDGSFNKNCKIIGNINDPTVDGFSVQTSMIIHALNGWNDIDLTQYVPSIAYNGNNIMLCGSDLDVMNSCNITHSNGIWNCLETYSNCYDATQAQNTIAATTTTTTTSTTTAITTNIPTITPTNTPTNALVDVINNCYTSIGSLDTGNLDITVTINCMDNTITFNIMYKEYNNNWFGLVFNTQMLGDAVIFTTGKNHDRSAALYAYHLTGKSLSDVIYDINKQWTQQAMILDIFASNGLRLIYQINLDETIWNANTNIIQFNEAIGQSLMLQRHIIRTTNTFNIHLIPQTTTTTKQPTQSPVTKTPTVSPTNIPTDKPTNRPSIIPTILPTTNPTSKPTINPSLNPTNNPIMICSNSNSISSKINTGNGNNELIVMAILNCVENTITMDITYNNYNHHWFGLIFNTQMNGKAIIYTTGHNGDKLPQLNSYDIFSRRTSDVVYNQNENWIEMLTETNTNSIHIVYKQELSKTQWNGNTKQIIFRYAIGQTLFLEYHQFRSDQVFTLDLTENIAPDMTTTTTTTSSTTTPTEVSLLQWNYTNTEIVQDKSITCDEDSMCAQSVVKCTEDTLNDDHICIINCISAQSCFGTTFECMNGYDCHLNCIGLESCLKSTFQCGDDSNCNVNGLAEKSLSQMQITQFHLLPNIVHNVKVECNGKNSCLQSAIFGGFADTLHVICGAQQSCNQIQIQCPPFTQQPNCKITATTTESIGDGIDIFAINSWKDIDNSSNLPYEYDTIIGMFCGANWNTNKCVMQVNNQHQNEWNCDDQISECYIDTYEYDSPVFIVRCNDEQPCHNEIISCGNEHKICRIICDGFGSCSSSDIICSSSALNNNIQQCEIICNGFGSCSDVSSIQCGRSQECDVKCVGDKSCSNISIGCGVNTQDIQDIQDIRSTEECTCNINGMNTQSLVGANINCFNNSNCNINCNEFDTCNDVTVNAKESNVMNMLCVNHSCNNIELFCPSYVTNNNIFADGEKQCIISGHGDIHNEFIIYAENSWKDIDLTNYFCIVNNNDDNSDNFVSSKMYCGKQLNDFCVIEMTNDSDWNCIDKESICYVSQNNEINSTMNDDINNENNSEERTDESDIAPNNSWTQSELVAVMVICCIVVVILSTLGIYCWCYKPNKTQNKYTNVNSPNNTKKKKRKKKKKKNTKTKQSKETIPMQDDYDNDNAIIEFHANMEQMTFNE